MRERKRREVSNLSAVEREEGEERQVAVGAVWLAKVVCEDTDAHAAMKRVEQGTKEREGVCAHLFATAARVAGARAVGTLLTHL